LADVVMVCIFFSGRTFSQRWINIGCRPLYSSLSQLLSLRCNHFVAIRCGLCNIHLLCSQEVIGDPFPCLAGTNGVRERDVRHNAVGNIGFWLRTSASSPGTGISFDIMVEKT
jgi:hypothetical protein